MAATLLQLVNKVRALLREEPLGAIDANDIQTAALVAIVNGAMRRILDDHDWSFLLREDGVLAFPEALTGVNLTHSPAGSTQVHVEDDAMADYRPLLDGDDFCFRFQVRGALANPDHANDSMRIVSADDGIFANTDRLTLDAWPGIQAANVVGTANWLLFSHETALPDTVARVLSVRDEDQRDVLLFQHQMLDLDRFVPSALEMTGGPFFVSVGGVIQNTTVLGSTGTIGMRFAIYPPYTVSTTSASLTRVRTRRVHYRYTYRFADLAAAGNSLIGVPDEVSELIVRRAFIDCLMSNVQMDPQRGVPMYLHLERDLQLALARDMRDPLRRLVPSAFGSRRSQIHPNARWASRQVPSP